MPIYTDKNTLTTTMDEKPQLKSRFIDPKVLELVKTLQENKYTTYIVGGCVRDLSLGIQPKDFDVVTSARPNQIKRIIRGSYIIGRRFRLVLVRRYELQIEVATFRKNQTEKKIPEAVQEDNIFGKPEEDALRRDFTINALFYDPLKESIIDHCGGLEDLKDRIVRMIGDPAVRLPEDPIRLLRATRLAHKIGFTLDPDLKTQMKIQAPSLKNSALPRRREEFIKLLRLKDPALAFLETCDLDILKYTSPLLEKAFKNEEFVDQFQKIKYSSLNPDQPEMLFGYLIHCYVRCFIERDPEKKISAIDLLEHPELSELMRNQLNIFKHEQNYICKALQIEISLTKRKEFERKSKKRTLVLIRNESFPLALELAKKDLLVSGEDILFWENSFQNLKDQIVVKPRNHGRSNFRGHGSRNSKNL